MAKKMEEFAEATSFLSTQLVRTPRSSSTALFGTFAAADGLPHTSPMTGHASTLNRSPVIHAQDESRHSSSAVSSRNASPRTKIYEGDPLDGRELDALLPPTASDEGSADSKSLSFRSSGPMIGATSSSPSRPLHAGFGTRSPRCATLRKLWSFVGPGFIVSAAFMDPGNIESDLQAGAYAGFQLLWVVGGATLLGLMFQTLAARLGTVTGRDLAQHCGTSLGKPDVAALWIVTQIAIVGSDIQEIVGSAIAFRVLFGIPLWAGCLLTGLDTLTFLGLHAQGIRRLEAAFGALLLVLSVSFFIDFFMAAPPVEKLAEGLFSPQLSERNHVQAAGILGAVVMPHNLFLHSALVLSRDVDHTQRNEVRQANTYFFLETAGALFLAFLVNAAIVSVFAHGFFAEACASATTSLQLAPSNHWVHPPYACVPTTAHGETSNMRCETSFGRVPGTCQPIGLQIASVSLEALLGEFARVVWALGLLAAGQTSTVSGTFAGQFVMEGFFDVRIPNWQRVAVTRFIALVPATMVAVLATHDYLLADSLDEWLNVLQSLLLPFALVPLLGLSARHDVMGSEFKIQGVFKSLTYGVLMLIVFVNLYLLTQHPELRGNVWIAVGLVVYLGMLARLHWLIRDEKKGMFA